MPTIFPTLPTPTEIGYAMMIIGYVVTIVAAYHALFAALEWAVKTLVRLTTELLAQYAPRTLVKLQAMSMWPIWVMWLVMDKSIASLQNSKDSIARQYLKRYERLEKAAKAVDVELVRR